MNIRYFAWVREKVGIEEETIELPSNVKTVSDLIAHLKDVLHFRVVSCFQLKSLLD